MFALTTDHKPVSFGNRRDRLGHRFRRIMAAVAQNSRPHIRRNSPLSAIAGLHGMSSEAGMLKRIDIGDSDSDDEPPPGIKFSKATQALLDDALIAPSPVKQQQQQTSYVIPRFNRSVSANKVGVGTPSRAPGIKVVRRSSPIAAGETKGTTPSRVVQVNTRGSASAKRSISVGGAYPHRFGARREPTPTRDARPEMITPAPAPRALRVHTRSGSSTSHNGRTDNGLSQRPESRDGARSGAESRSELSVGELNRSTSAHNAPDTASRFGTSTAARSRNPSADPAPPPGSTRIKRAPIGTGSFLKSGPVRRGFRRRDSDENVSPADEAPNVFVANSNGVHFTPRERSLSRTEGSQIKRGSPNSRAKSVEPVSVHDFAARQQISREYRPSSRQAESHISRTNNADDFKPTPQSMTGEQARSRAPSRERPPMRRLQAIHKDDAQQQGSGVENAQRRSALDSVPPHRAASLRAQQFRGVPPKVTTDAAEDQENVPPPTFRRNRDQAKPLGKPSIKILSDDEIRRPRDQQVGEKHAMASQQQHEPRRALGAININTPQRAAPAPPPKMSVIDTATTTAGASVTKSKKKRSHILINGKIFTQMGKIGKGGSSDVYCVMAENYKTFALKRVKLDDCDESAVRGFKGEIDLLKKLTEVERVVRLFDWEMNTDKQELLVLMERGDTDLNRLLTHRLTGDNARYDAIFTRYHWREMLECVLAVHEQDIVHSDLKPANFLFVQGRLKLIDFGIANAIETDHTVNVHRDTHVGTPNYMSPESITDTNAPQAGGPQLKDAGGRPLKKDMRIGKASDVWSLGCILYQMAYGRPPFAHIPNQLSRIMAITNPNHTITFAATGVGNVPIPASLRGCLRKCLNRDPDKRPTIQQLLGNDDAFMNPERNGTVLMDEQLLGQIIGKVVERCRDSRRGIPGSDEVKGYPRSFMEKIEAMVEKGGA